MMKIVAVILIVVGIVLFFLKQNQSKITASLSNARATTVEELHTMAGAIASEIGGGSWRDYVKIWGKITTDSPLYSEMKKEACVYYSNSVTREYEEKVREKKEDGTIEERIVKKSQNISNNQRSIPFFLEDKTGAIAINPDNADIDTIKILDEFQQGEVVGNMVSWGNFSLVLNSSLVNSGNRTLGYRYRESILPIDREVLVVGEVSDETGDLKIINPITTNNKFIISLKSDEVLMKNTQEAEKNIFIGMLFCFAIGFILVIISLF